jgi:uncharacterized membrane protein (Fun14 family)
MQIGFLDTLKENLSPRVLMQKVADNKQMLILAGLYLIAGFVTAYVIKKCNKFIFCTALIIGTVLFLQYYGYIVVAVDWGKIQELLGIKPLVLPNEHMVPVYWEWIKGNIALVASFSVGFVFGLRIA